MSPFYPDPGLMCCMPPPALPPALPLDPQVAVSAPGGGLLFVVAVLLAVAIHGALARRAGAVA